MRSDDQNVEGRKVGALARATGLTVRTLHHYEQIGLLVASARSDGGHRLYSASDEQVHVVHGEIHAGDGVIWLHRESPEFGLASPRTLGAATASLAVIVDDVDAHFRQAVDRGATIEYEPVDQPYGYREYSARDSEGGLWSFMSPLD